MPIGLTCPICSANLQLANELAGKLTVCPYCKGDIQVPKMGALASVRRPVVPRQAKTANGPIRSDHDEREFSNAKERSRSTGSELTSYPRMRREFLFVQLRQRMRALCGKVGLGQSAGERICCALMVAVVPFAISFGLSFTLHQPALYASLQGLVAFAIVATFCSVLVTKGGSDETLESRRMQIAKDLPTAREAWIEEQEKARWERRKNKRTLDRASQTDEPARPTTRRCPYCTEVIPFDARKCKHCGEFVSESDRQAARAVHVQGQGRSGGVAAVLELIFGLFFGTFGIGHIYAGNVGTGLFILFGWWLFVGINAVLTFFTCGVWGIVAVILVPACWFIMLIASPLTAASSVSEP